MTNGDAFRQWPFGTALYRAQAVGVLRQAVALDPGLHVVIAHGLFDLVRPYLGSQWLINQIAPGAGADRVKLVTYPSGHMFHTRDASRAALHAEAVTLLTSVP